MQPAPGCDSIRFVVETFRKDFRKIFERGLTQQLGVNLCHPVGAVRTYDRQIGHTKLLGSTVPLFNKAHAMNPFLVARKTSANIAQKTAVDFIDDLELPGQHVFKPRYRPFFKRFGQQGVIGVRQRVLRDVPGFIPFKVHLINQDSHELRHGQSGCVSFI